MIFQRGPLSPPLDPHLEGASKLTGISNKTITRIKADSENAVLAPRKPWRDRMELSAFDKCELWINCKIIDNKKRQQTIYNKNIFDFGFRTTISSLLYQKVITNVYVRPTDWATKPFKVSLWYKLFCYHYTVNMHQTPCSLIWCNGKIHLTGSLSQYIVNEQ